MTVSLSTCAIDNCTHNFGRVAIFVLTNIAFGETLEGSRPFAVWFLLYYGRPTWKTCNGLVLLTFIFSVGHPNCGASL